MFEALSIEGMQRWNLYKTTSRQKFPQGSLGNWANDAKSNEKQYSTVHNSIQR